MTDNGGVVWYTIHNFNSHAHVERDGKTYAVCKQEIDFNSHAHVERDDRIFTYFTDIDISTHTLTWSVTVLHMNGFNVNIFQLTRSRGA